MHFSSPHKQKDSRMNSIYDITCQSINGEDQPLSRFKDRVLLIVNTASKCGFTPQFQGLETLYKQYHAQGFEVLGFPCNQFGSQDPGSHEEIQNFCQTNYGVSFPYVRQDRRERTQYASPLSTSQKPSARLNGVGSHQMELHQISCRSIGKSP